METTPMAETPIACNLEAEHFRERLDWIAALNRAALLEARQEGLRLFLTYSRDHSERVREMVRREQKCCGFLGFDLTESDDGVRLVIVAPEDVSDRLNAVFDPFLPASAQSQISACADSSNRKGEGNDGC